jgi:hypothetical protein
LSIYPEINKRLSITVKNMLKINMESLSVSLKGLKPEKDLFLSKLLTIIITEDGREKLTKNDYPEKFFEELKSCFEYETKKETEDAEALYFKRLQSCIAHAEKEYYPNIEKYIEYKKIVMIEPSFKEDIIDLCGTIDANIETHFKEHSDIEFLKDIELMVIGCFAIKSTYQKNGLVGFIAQQTKLGSYWNIKNKNDNKNKKGSLTTIKEDCDEFIKWRKDTGKPKPIVDITTRLASNVKQQLNDKPKLNQKIKNGVYGLIEELIETGKITQEQFEADLIEYGNRIKKIQGKN